MTWPGDGGRLRAQLMRQLRAPEPTSQWKAGLGSTLGIVEILAGTTTEALDSWLVTLRAACAGYPELAAPLAVVDTAAGPGLWLDAAARDDAPVPAAALAAAGIDPGSVWSIRGGRIALTSTATVLTKAVTRHDAPGEDAALPASVARLTQAVPGIRAGGIHLPSAPPPSIIDIPPSPRPRIPAAIPPAPSPSPSPDTREPVATAPIGTAPIGAAPIVIVPVATAPASPPREPWLTANATIPAPLLTSPPVPTAQLEPALPAAGGPPREDWLPLPRADPGKRRRRLPAVLAGGVLLAVIGIGTGVAVATSGATSRPVRPRTPVARVAPVTAVSSAAVPAQVPIPPAAVVAAAPAVTPTPMTVRSPAPKHHAASHREPKVSAGPVRPSPAAAVVPARTYAPVPPPRPVVVTGRVPVPGHSSAQPVATATVAPPK